MESAFRYRHRILTEADVDCIRQLIAQHPGASRRCLPEKLCEAWHWVQPNGRLRAMPCRGLMLALHRAGRPRGCNPCSRSRDAGLVPPGFQVFKLQRSLKRRSLAFFFGFHRTK